MTRKRPMRFGCDPMSRGTAMIEFAMILPVMIILLGVIFDIGFAYHDRLNLVNLAAAGGQFAVQNGGTVTSATIAQFRSDVVSQAMNASQLTIPPTVTVLFNGSAGTATVDNFYCLAGPPTNWSNASAAAVDCGDGTVAGKFVTITIILQSPPIFPIAGVLPQLLQQQESIIVRVI